ncbi:MurT ligase domain-containing protein, partial [Spirillospora sp. NPDC047418]
SINAQGPDGRDTSWLWDVDYRILRGMGASITTTRRRSTSWRLRLTGRDHRRAGRGVRRTLWSRPGRLFGSVVAAASRRSAVGGGCWLNWASCGRTSRGRAGRGTRGAGRGARGAGRGARDAGRGTRGAGRGARDAGRGSREARGRAGRGKASHAGGRYAGSRLPLFTVSRKAAQASAPKPSTGPSGSLESRARTVVSPVATSTH